MVPPDPTKRPPDNSIIRWNPWELNDLVINALVITLPADTRNQHDQNLFTTRNVLCCLRHDPAYASKLCTLKDLDNTLENITSLALLEPWYTRWLNESRHTNRKRTAKDWIRDTFLEVKEKKQRLLEGIVGVTTESDLKNEHLFPPGSLDYLCGGMHAGMILLHLAALLRARFTTAEHQSQQLDPFSQRNIVRIFDFLRVAGWDVYDIWEVFSRRSPLYDPVQLGLFTHRAESVLGHRVLFESAPYTM
ncbi:MAG: hypothetical protein LQ349_004691 [Xanthoria aureola]|nr:MAG: hypothetical protein LQ349_004691 [Xanthoria aureola]